jgi:hypothetical protein
MTSPAIALDETLRALTSGQLAELRAMMPAWLVDQADAAADQIRRALPDAHAAGAPLTVAEHPDWVRLAICDTFVTWWQGRHTTCTHAPHPLRPRPVASAAWKPGVVVCARCTHLLALPDGSTADRTCDGCGRIVAGHGDDLMYPCTVIAGILTYSVGACADCRYWPDAGGVAR